jgi:Protein of unknown function (DUF3455)
MDRRFPTSSSARLFAMIKKLPQLIVLIGIAVHANGQGTPSDLPEKIKAPIDQKVVLKAHASGAQIYTCQQGTYGRYAWTLKGPEAELTDSGGTVIGRHYAGPTWKHNDGSEVTGKAVAQVDSPDANSIAWLLVTATGHSGSGVLSQITSIQRIHTAGGRPPAAADCSSSNQNSEVKSSYTADYYFYVTAK